jgi:hypothetical protein
MNEEKTKVFEKELSYINNPRYKEGVQKLISLLPDYFFEVPASSVRSPFFTNLGLNEGK